jgi:hypothetical protein
VWCFSQSCRTKFASKALGREKGSKWMPTTGKFFDTLVLMVLENHGWAQVQQCKFVSHLRQHGVVFTGWQAVTHPSDGAPR